MGYIMKRVVITGFGILSSIGNNEEEVLNSLLEGKSGITFSEEMKTMGMNSQVWGNIKIDVSKLMIDKKMLKFMNDASIYAYIAMYHAIKNSNLKSYMYQNNPKVGVIAGSSTGSPRFQISEIQKKKIGNRLRFLNPYTIIKTMNSSVSACLATFFRIYGVNYSVSSACASSAHCIGNAFELIKSGKQDLIFAGGGEELTWEVACSFDVMRALSRKYNKKPFKASRAYDCNRDGFVISGGSGIIIVEELKHALLRNAKIYAEIIGYAATSDGWNMTVPSIEGAVRCMQLSLTGVNLKVDYLNTHGTSTLIGDIKELIAISKVFNKEKIPLLSSTKSMTGHSLGVSGVHEIIYTLLMLNNNFIAPSINIENIDPLAKNMNIVTKKINKKITVAMSNSFGFGGSNASIVIKKYS